MPGTLAERCFRLGLDLLLLGAEVRRFGRLRVARDPLHPALWDRHLVVPAGEAQDPVRELTRLDAFYRESGAAEWSLYGLDREAARSWALAWQGRGFERDDELLMGGPPEALASSRDAGPGNDSVVVTLHADPNRVGSLLTAIAAGEAARQAVGHRLALLAERKRRGLGTVALAAASTVDGGPAGVTFLTVIGEDAWWEDLEVAPGRRRQGVARCLLLAAAAASARRGARRIAFTAGAVSWQGAWYGRLGFHVLARVIRLRRREVASNRRSLLT